MSSWYERSVGTEAGWTGRDRPSAGERHLCQWREGTKCPLRLGPHPDAVRAGGNAADRPRRQRATRICRGHTRTELGGAVSGDVALADFQSVKIDLGNGHHRTVAPRRRRGPVHHDVMGVRHDGEKAQ